MNRLTLPFQRSQIPFRICLALLVLLGLLTSCSPQSAAPAPSEQHGAVSQPTEAPAAEAPAETEAPAEPAVQPTQPLPATSLPAVVTPAPTQPALPTPTSQSQPTQPETAPTQPAPEPLEERLVELEWPAGMRLGDSDVIRLALIPAKDGYVLQTEFPDHQVQGQDVRVPRPGGYDLFAVARLDGVGFEIAPTGEQEQFLPAGQPVEWRWSLTPRRAGQQRLSIRLALRWKPAPGSLGALREVAIYSKGLDVPVHSFLGLTQPKALLTGLFGLLFGGGISLFALVFRPPSARPFPGSGTTGRRKPNPNLVIEPPPGLSLAPAERVLLQSLFGRYGRLVIEQEFLSGYSGARTFLAHPIRPDGRADAYTIAKIGEAGSIRREFENYEAYVRDTLPPITARIQHPPVVLDPGSLQLPRTAPHLAAIQYTFIGEQGSTPTSLRRALLANPDPELLRKLFDTFGPHWWMQRRPYTFRLAAEYDRVLPTHLVIEPLNPTAVKTAGRPRPVDGRTPPARLGYAQGPQVGEIVSLEHFPRAERRLDGQSLSLSDAPAPGQPPLRLRWLGPELPPHPTGRVVATRQTLLDGFVAGLDLAGLPDPRPRLLPGGVLLDETLSASQSTIHGDLNLENALAGPGGLIWLIDFASTRDGHTLFDFAHLWAELVAHILAPQVSEPADFLCILQGSPSPAHAALPPLFAALDEMAARCLFNPSQPREWRLARTLACLGALKYANLDSHARHFLYISTAYDAQGL